jgi:adenylate cyclase
VHNLSQQGTVRDEEGQGYLFRLTKFTLGVALGGSILPLAAGDDFVQECS